MRVIDLQIRVRSSGSYSFTIGENGRRSLISSTLVFRIIPHCRAIETAVVGKSLPQSELVRDSSAPSDHEEPDSSSTTNMHNFGNVLPRRILPDSDFFMNSAYHNPDKSNASEIVFDKSRYNVAK